MVVDLTGPSGITLEKSAPETLLVAARRCGGLLFWQLMRSHTLHCSSRTAVAATAAVVLLALAPLAPAQSNWGVAADNRGTLYFCDIQRDRVWRYVPQGHLDLLLDHNHCHTLVLGYDGDIYGENVGGESRAGGVVGVWRLTPETPR